MGEPTAVAIGDAVEVVLQPFGGFVASRSARCYDVLNRSATAVLLYHVVPRNLREALSWARDRGMRPRTMKDMREMLISRHYLTVSRGVPKISMMPESGAMRATRAEIEITNRCNLRCAYCYAEANTSKFELDSEQWIEILTGMHANGLRAVLFSGGEPFLHRGFERILDWAGERLVIEINSNGRYITDRVVSHLARLPIKAIQISLDSVSAAHHDSLRGKGSHAYAVAAIKRLTTAGIPTVVSAVITASNRPQLPDIRAYVESLGASFKGDPVTRTGYAQDIDDVAWVRDFAVRREDRVFEDPQAGFEPLCQSQVGYVAVSHTGMLKPCNMREGFFEPTGDALLQSRQDEWWTRPYGESRVAISGRSLLPIASKSEGNVGGHYVCDLQRTILKA